MNKAETYIRAKDCHEAAFNELSEEIEPFIRSQLGKRNLRSKYGSIGEIRNYTKYNWKSCSSGVMISDNKEVKNRVELNLTILVHDLPYGTIFFEGINSGAASAFIIYLFDERKEVSDED